jgi:hypothetical protein
MASVAGGHTLRLPATWRTAAHCRSWPAERAGEVNEPEDQCRPASDGYGAIVFCWEGSVRHPPGGGYPKAPATIPATYSCPDCVRRGSVFLGLAEEGQHGSRA